MNLEQFSQFQFDEELYKKFDIRQLNGDLVKDKRELIQLVNESIFRKCARTSKEKLEVLDLRDKFLKIIRYEVNNSNTSSSSSNNNEYQQLSSDILVGTCMDMCPEKERYHRETLSLCNKYEFDQNEMIDHRLMVKEYSRSSADQDLPLPNELRPINILYETMLYLIDEIIPQIVIDYNTNENDQIKFQICDWYDFVWNRTRSIRKDIIQQRLLLNDNEINKSSNNSLISNGLGGVIIIEQCARFHIMCAHRLCEESSDVFSFKINEENLKNCFQSLRQYYETSSLSSLNNQQQQQTNKTTIPSPNESEFRSYIILLNLNESDILCAIQRWPSNVRNSRHVKFALKIYFAYNSRNFVRFFRLIKSDDCEYLQACILHRYFYKVRCEAFKSIFTAFKDQKERVFPLAKLNELLAFDNESDIIGYCDLFGLEVDDSNVIMPIAMLYSCFKLTKVNEDKLKANRSHLLVESKFTQNLMSKSWTNTKCMSKIIAGAAVENTTGHYAYDSDYELTTCFNEEGYYCSNEIDQMLEFAKQKKANLASEISTGNKSTSAPSFLRINRNNKTATIKIANQLVRRSKEKKSIVQNETSEGGDFIKRKTSTSSSSSTESKLKSKRIAEVPTERADKKQSFQLKSSTRPLFKPTQSAASQQPNPFQTAKPIESNPFSSMQTFKPSKFGESTVPNLFSTIVSKTAPTNPLPLMSETKFSNFTSFQKPSVPISLFAPPKDVTKPEQKNLFEDILKKQDQDDYTARKEKFLDQKSETFFENLYLSIVKDVSEDFILLNRDLPKKISNNLLESIVDDQIRTICSEILPQMKNYEKTKLENELRQKQLEMKRRQEEQIYFNQLNSILETCFDDILKDVTTTLCYSLITFRKNMETNIYDDVICEVFQKEFEIIIKQVANELNYEITLDKLAESLYFNNESFHSDNNTSVEPKDDEEINEANEVMESKQSNLLEIMQPISLAQNSVNLNSIFMTDLCSCLHESIYECTRLNLNVNRELYYELKQALVLNEKKYLFRKWRLKLSVKLLKAAHKRASIDLKPQNRSKSLNQQINLISFIKSYGNYLVNNLNRFQKVLSFMILNSADYSIVHCEQFQMHLTWNMNLNYKHYLYEILLDNYFDIIHNRDDSIILPPLASSSSSSLSFSLNDSLENKTIAINNSNELFSKTVVIMPKLCEAKNDSDDDIEAIKRWLMTKFFHFDSTKSYSYETKHIENLFVTTLHSNAYGLRFCIKECSTNLTENEYQSKLAKRTLYGANSVVYILVPIKQNQSFQNYLIENKKMLFQILKLFNENLDLDSLSSLGNYQYMFISYLSTSEETKQVIQFILGDKNTANFTFCLLDGDVIKDNSLLQLTFQEFLQKTYKQNSNIHSLKTDSNRLNHEQINNILPLASIFEMTLMKFFEFLTHSSSTKCIYLSLSSIIDEYNSRLDQLIKLLTPDEYKQLGWPIPEFIDSDFTSDSSYSILKYWNTNECFENTIKKQFYNLLYLEKTQIDENDELNGEIMDIDSLEVKFLDYLNNLLKSKIKNGTLPAKSKCIKSIYQLESVIKLSFKKLKNSNTKETKSVSKLNIKWSEMVIAIIEYLLTCGYLTFQNSKQIYLDKFYFYYNMEKLKSYDWVNNCLACSSTVTSPASSIISLDLKPSNYIIRKYERKDFKRIEFDDSVLNYKQIGTNLKRRFSDESYDTTEPNSNRLSPEFEPKKDQSALVSPIKQMKYQRLSVTPLRPETKATEFEMKFKEFFDLLNTEKENNREFESRLTKHQSGTNNKVKDFLANDDVLVNSMNLNNEIENLNLNKTFETFLERLNEEKTKNEQFNSKLNQMLDF